MQKQVSRKPGSLGKQGLTGLEARGSPSGAGGAVGDRAGSSAGQ